MGFNFAIDNDGTKDRTGPYDIDSLMHYGAFAFAKQGSGLPTMTRANGGSFHTDYVSGPSTLDAQRVCKLYPQRCPKAIQCAGLGCPVSCTKACPQNPACNDGSNDAPPPCCDTFGIAECKKKQAECKSCEFLLS